MEHHKIEVTMKTSITLYDGNCFETLHKALVVKAFKSPDTSTRLYLIMELKVIPSKWVILYTMGIMPIHLYSHHGQMDKPISMKLCSGVRRVSRVVYI